MMNKLLLTYALAKSLYERGSDYLDTFWPFVLKVLPQEKSHAKLDSIQEKVRGRFGLDIPEYSLRTIVNRAKAKGYVEKLKQGKLIQEQDRFRLTDRGVAYLGQLEPESEANRRINELLVDIRNHLNKVKEDSQLSLDDTYKIVLNFINENIYSIVEFFNPDTEITKLAIPDKQVRKYENDLVQYFEIAEVQKPSLYKTLQDIVYGSIISLAASTENIAEINKKFEGTQVFLDSNVIFSLLELHPHVLNMYCLMKMV